MRYVFASEEVHSFLLLGTAQRTNEIRFETLKTSAALSLYASSHIAAHSVSIYEGYYLPWFNLFSICIITLICILNIMCAITINIVSNLNSITLYDSYSNQMNSSINSIKYIHNTIHSFEMVKILINLIFTNIINNNTLFILLCIIWITNAFISTINWFTGSSTDPSLPLAHTPTPSLPRFTAATPTY